MPDDVAHDYSLTLDVRGTFSKTDLLKVLVFGLVTFFLFWMTQSVWIKSIQHR